METFGGGRWWRLAAVLISTIIAVIPVANLFTHWTGDEGAPYGRFGLSSIALLGAAFVFGGLTVRRRHPRPGSVMIGAGMIPTFLLITVPWFPLLAAAGVLAAVVIFMATVDALSQPGQTISG
ncbi:MAG: hypothetical protein WD895_06015 [Acidimicrobiia bacterium]